MLTNNLLLLINNNRGYLLLNLNMRFLVKLFLIISILLSSQLVYAQLFQEDFGTAFASISTVKWPTACRGSSPTSFNTSAGACAGTSDYEYPLSGVAKYITTQAITIPSTGYDLTFDYAFNNTFSFPIIEIRTGASCGTTLSGTTTLANTSGVCTPQAISLNAYAGQTIYIRFVSNSSSTFYFDDVLVDIGSGGGGCLLTEDFGTALSTISSTNWPSTCRSGSASSFNTSLGACAATLDYEYSLTGFNYITTSALAIPSTGYDLTFDYAFNNTFSFPSIQIRTGASCGTTLLSTITLTNTSGVCTQQSINLNAYAGQTIYIRFNSNTSSTAFYFDDVNVCNNISPSGDLKWADNFNDNDLDLDYTGNDGDESCTGCGSWVLGNGATLALVPSSGWNGNSNKTEAFTANMANVYYAKLERNEYIESPIIDLSGQESVKISFYAKSSSSGTGGGDSWSGFSDHLRLQIWDGTSWITVKDITEGTTVLENKISPALPFNYFCFTAYKNATSPGNYYYTTSPNVNSAYFHSDFKFRVIFEGGFSGAPFAWVDDFTFRADADGYSTMIPCGISFWNEPTATGYGQDPEATLANNSERGVELELDNSINIPPNWATQANDGDTVTQIFGVGESERVVFCVLSEQEINFAFPVVNFSSPSIGNRSSVMSKDNNYTGPGWKYYAVEYISCDLSGGSISEPTNQFEYYYVFEYGNEFIPVFYQLNKSGIEMGGGVTSVFERFDKPDVISLDNCGLVLPIELLSFKAMLRDQKVILDWETASELNNNYFEIHRSKDAIDFEILGTVKGKGNSNDLNLYQYVDDFPLDDVSYYRLKQIDFNGDFSYSKIVAVKFFNNIITIYPNPTQEELTILNLGNKLITITDISGKEVKDFKLKGNKINVYDLPNGMYFIHFSENNLNKVTKKFIKY
jgi:hypothetical protein